MNCNESTFLLERRWDGALSGEEERALGEHLTACAACRAESRAIAAADIAFLALPALEPPVDIAAAVSRRIAQEAPAEPNRGVFWAAFALAALLAALFWQSGVTPAVLWNSAPVAALAGPVESVLHGWWGPIRIYAGAASPLLAVLAPVAAVLTLLEIGVAGLFVARRAADVS